MLYEEEEGSSDSSHPGSASSEDEDIFEETAQVTHTHTHTHCDNTTMIQLILSNLSFKSCTENDVFLLFDIKSRKTL